MKPLTWWQRNSVQGRAEVLLFYVLALLLVVLFVFWATAGWAEHVTSDGCNTCTQTGPSSYQCTAMYCMDAKELAEFERKMAAHKKDDCLAKMEAAMRAIEKEFYYKRGEHMIFPFKPDHEPIPGDVGPLIQQWDAVKKECWRQP